MMSVNNRENILYLGGHSASEEYCIAEIEGRRVGEHAQPVPAVGCHPEGAVPFIQGEEERSEVQCDKNAHPHGPMERPHEGSDGSCSVVASNLKCHK